MTSQKKDMSTLTAEQLIEMAKVGLRDPNEKKEITIPPVRRFVVSENLKDGDSDIPAILIYDRYVRWCAIHNEDVLSKGPFFQEFKSYFSKHRKNNGMFYKMNPGGFDMSVEYLRMLNERVKEKGFSNGNKKSKKNREKQKEIKQLFSETYKK